MTHMTAIVSILAAARAVKAARAIGLVRLEGNRMI